MNRPHDTLERLRSLLAEAGQDAALLTEMRELIDAELVQISALDGAATDAWHGMVGQTEPVLSLRALIEKFARVKTPVLILGESGTGKELIARALHQVSPRRVRPFVAENCAAIPENLLESVLFGHVRGAFTGAVRDHPGHFASADKGSIFLDEIGDMPLSMQVKLLRTLQEGEVRPVGGSELRKIDVRVIAASNQDLAKLVSEGSFREDLYYRLNALQLKSPPLRERGADILLLARYFLAATGSLLEFDETAEKALLSARWPGNVRQLQNEMQRLAALCDGPEVCREDLSEDLRL